MTTLSGREIVLGVTGGIAAYKACEIVREMRKEGANVHVILTASGSQFITPLTLQTLSKNPVYTDMWDLISESEIGHISLAQRANLLMIAPATANILGKIRGGIADDMPLRDWLEKKIFPAEAKNVSPEFVKAGTTLACLEMVRGGTTTFADMYYYESDVAAAVDACGMRAVLGEIAASQTSLNSRITTTQQVAVAYSDNAIAFVSTRDLPLKGDWSVHHLANREDGRFGGIDNGVE